MGPGLEAFDGFAADASGGAVWVIQFRVLGFEVSEFGQMAVELGIGHDGCGIGVVRSVGAFEEVPEFGDCGFGGLGGHGYMVPRV